MAQRPNIIVLMADTVMRQALGCYGGVVKTPHLDALAGQAHRFEQLYQPANMCQPSRVTWMTGCLPSTTQVYHNGFGNNQRKQQTLLRALSQAGYRGGYLGLFHCWPGADRDGLDDWQWIDWMYDWNEHGKDWNVSADAGAAWKQRLHSMGIMAPEYHLRDYHHHAGHTDFPLAYHPAVRLADQALTCIRDFSRERPNLLWTSFWMPHEPWAPPREFLQLHALEAMPLSPSYREGLTGSTPRLGTAGPRATFLELAPDYELNLRRIYQAYAGCMALVDEQMGRIIAELKAQGLYDESLIVFCTDHGTTHGAHGWMYKGGSFMCDEVSRVPCMVKLPGQQTPTTITDIVSSADLYPTLLEHLGISHPQVDGESWSGLFAGLPRTNARAFTQHLAGATLGGEAVRSLRRGPYKFTLFSTPGVEELFDLTSDPSEQHNLVAELPQVRQELRAELVDFIARSPDQFVIPSAI
jgi:arylsulfatase A-like enzyme